MATSTTNLNLIKPSGTDKIRIAQINQNMDILDEKIGPVGNTSVQNQIIANDSGIAFLSTGNTHVAIASGQYVYIRSHGTLAEGLYKANSAISANATLSTSNVTRVSSGGMNDLKEQIDSLNSKLEYKAGDRISGPTQWCSFAGICKSAKRVVEFTIPIEKYLSVNRTVNVTLFQGYILKNTGGNLHGNTNYVNFTGCTISAQAVSSNFVLVTLTFDSDLDLPNTSSVTFNGTFSINIS